MHAAPAQTDLVLSQLYDHGVKIGQLEKGQEAQKEAASKSEQSFKEAVQELRAEYLRSSERIERNVSKVIWGLVISLLTFAGYVVGPTVAKLLK